MKNNFSKILVIIMMILLASIFSSVDFVTGSMIEGGGFPLLFTGFGGLSYPLSSGSFTLNPALAAVLYANEGSLLFGGFQDSLFISSYFNFILDFGNLSFFGSYAGNNTGLYYLDFKAAFSKLISENFYAGFDLNIYTMGFNKFGFGFDIGITSLTSIEPVPKGFSFSQFSYAFILKNLGLPITFKYSGEEYTLPPIGLGAGVNFAFLNVADIMFARLYSDLYLYLYPFGVNFKGGLILSFLDYIDLTAGFTVGTDNASIMSSNWFFLGVYATIPLKENSINISYGYTPSTTSPTHSIYGSFAFGKVDKKAPIARVTVKTDSPRNAFSPNYDGQKDEINLIPDFSDNGLLAGWKISIYDQSSNLVKEFIAQDVRKINYVTIGKIISRLFEKKKAVEVPGFVAWDGTNTDGKVVPDGVYKVIGTVWDERYNQTETEPIYITVDNTIDPFDISPETNIFSPNNDGNLDKFKATIKFNNFEDYANCSITILNSSSTVVAEFNYDIKDIDNENLIFIWDGKNKSGNVANEGIYQLVVKYSDDAANQIIKTFDKIQLVIKYEIISVKNRNDYNYISSNETSRQDNIDLYIDYSSKEGLRKVIIKIVDKDNKVVYQEEYKDDFPSVFKINVKDKKYDLPDGTYTIKVETVYENGNTPVSNELVYIKDSSTPTGNIKEQYPAFSPNNDGIQDDITFEIEKDKSDKIIEVYIVSEKERYSFPINSIDKDNFIWDGKDSQGNEIPAGSYFLECKIQDPAGNISKIQSKPISLVRKAEEVSVLSDTGYYSPNDDNKFDSIKFTFSAENKENVVGMDLLIEDTNHQIVYTKKFVKFQKDFSFSEKLDEGKYFYYIKVYYNNGNMPLSLKRNFIVDLTKPSITLSAIQQYFTTVEKFSNSAKVEFKISEDVASCNYSILDQNKKPIESSDNIGISGIIQWNGKRSNISYQEGVYYIKVESTDLAGNQNSNEIPVYLITSEPELVIKIANSTISPNQDGLLDSTNVDFAYKDSGTKVLDQLIGKRIVITNQDKKIVEKTDLQLNQNSYNFAGRGLTDGEYQISIIYEFASGIISQAEATIYIDLTPPKTDLVLKPELFSPDGDGEKDTLYITYSLQDFSNIDSYTIRIYRLYEDGKKSVKPFKTFQFSKINDNKATNQIQWDGKGDEPDSMVDSATDYVLTLTAIDVVGNSITKQENFTVDILVLKTDIGYKIIINSIEFDLNSTKLKPSHYKILDLLIKKLLKFPDYRIMIVGFTDSTGDDAYNLKLSELRAKAVFDYLVRNDFPKNRLEYKGMGEQNPIDSNDTEEGRRRNRRVEFYLIKMQQ